MPKSSFLPHADLCPEGTMFDAESGQRFVMPRSKTTLKRTRVEMSCACTTCHVVVREGFGIARNHRMNWKTIKQG